MRGLVITLVALTFFSAMFITNDVALVTFVPFAVAVLIMAGQEDKTILVGALMTIGANVGSMLTPIGNAHNLYLKALTGMPTMEFLGIMAPYSATAAVMLVIMISVVFGGKPVGDLGRRLETGVLAPERASTSPTRSVSPATAPVMAAGAPSSTRCCSSSVCSPSVTDSPVGDVRDRVRRVPVHATGAYSRTWIGDCRSPSACSSSSSAT